MRTRHSLDVPLGLPLGKALLENGGDELYAIDDEYTGRHNTRRDEITRETWGAA